MSNCRYNSRIKLDFFFTARYNTFTLQIDRTYPEVSLTINEDLLDSGVLAVNLMKNDSGSGIKNVDIYKIMPGTYSIRHHARCVISTG